MTTALLPRARGRRGIVLSLLTVALAFLTSCGEGVTATMQSSTPHDVIIVGKPAARVGDAARRLGEQDSTEPTSTVVPSREDLLDERRVVPDDVTIDPDDPTQLVVRFTAAAPPCSGARLSVHPGPATVDVALYVGTPPEHAATVCNTSVRTLEVRAALDRPLGTRDLIWRID